MNQACEGYGQMPAPLMFVGISAGKRGALKTRVPFTKDMSGQLFQACLYELGLSRTSDCKSQLPDLKCWVTNLCKERVLDKVGNNRLPTLKEVETCWPLFLAERKEVDPKIVVALGGFVHQHLFRKGVWHIEVKHPRYYGSHGALSWGNGAFRDMVSDYRRVLSHLKENYPQDYMVMMR